MSIHNDDRQYGSDKERKEWEQELAYEYRKQDYDDIVEHYEKLNAYYDRKVGR